MDLMKLEFGDLDQNGGDSESATKHAVVFLVEATGKLNRHAATIKSYIAPILSYFRNVNKSGDSEMARLVLANAGSVASRRYIHLVYLGQFALFFQCGVAKGRPVWICLLLFRRLAISSD